MNEFLKEVQRQQLIFTIKVLLSIVIITAFLTYLIGSHYIARANEIEQNGQIIIVAFNDPQPTYEVAKITAYTCDPTMNEKQRKLNCPSLDYSPKGRTATGTTPHYGVLACDKSMLGKKIEFKGIDQVFTCSDLGGSIKGNHFDVYVETYQEAIEFGVQSREYREVL